MPGERNGSRPQEKNRSGRRSSLLVLVVSDLEVPVVKSTVELTGPNLRRGWMVLLAGASSIRSNTSVTTLGHCWLFLKDTGPDQETIAGTPQGKGAESGGVGWRPPAGTERPIRGKILLWLFFLC